MPIIIRAATEDDLPGLLMLYRELHAGDPELPAGLAAHRWREISAQVGRTILVAAGPTSAGDPTSAAGPTSAGDPTGVVGTVDITVLPNLTRGGQPFMLVENVVVAAAARRRGVGRRLLEAAITAAGEAGCYKVQLLTAMGRAGAHAFYEACGLRPVAQGYRAYLR
ncbi:MAG TPA: GNAT family N-acetyltransferase [Pilimelia sp.]|nr:GNAT family N-acetyltransferase [Pilimelia sp.]